jgi:hypothetical protein
VYTETEVFDYCELERRLKHLEDEGISEAVAKYLKENPVQAGATEEEVKQIQQNAEAIKTKVDKSGWNADKFLGTDPDENVVEKEIEIPEGNVIAPLPLLADVTSTEALNIFEVTLPKRAVRRVLMQVTTPADVAGSAYGRINGKFWDGLIFGNDGLKTNAPKWVELEFVEGGFAKYTASPVGGGIWSATSVRTCGRLEAIEYADSIGVSVVANAPMPAGTRIQVWGE